MNLLRYLAGIALPVLGSAAQSAEFFKDWAISFQHHCIDLGQSIPSDLNLLSPVI